jgi:hypothetical protein
MFYRYNIRRIFIIDLLLHGLSFKGSFDFVLKQPRMIEWSYSFATTLLQHLMLNHQLSLLVKWWLALDKLLIVAQRRTDQSYNGTSLILLRENSEYK